MIAYTEIILFQINPKILNKLSLSHTVDKCIDRYW